MVTISSLGCDGTCGTCLCVREKNEGRRRAVLTLVRPDQVRRLFRSKFPWEPVTPAPAMVASWLRRSFANGTLRYIPDPPDCDRWCSPAATLELGGGDCDDLAILGASMLVAAGELPAVVIGRHCAGLTCAGHAWIEGRDARGGYLLEPTTGELHRGRRPLAYKADLAVIPNPLRRVA